MLDNRYTTYLKCISNVNINKILVILVILDKLTIKLFFELRLVSVSVRNMLLYPILSLSQGSGLVFL